MFFVVGFHRGFESGECAVNLFVYGDVYFGGCGPENHNAVNAVFFFEVADVFAELFDHFPTGLADHDVAAVEALCVVVVEGGLEGLDRFEFILYGVDVLFFEDFGVDG